MVFNQGRILPARNVMARMIIVGMFASMIWQNPTKLAQLSLHGNTHHNQMALKTLTEAWQQHSGTRKCMAP
eukprot:3039853-Amphidinium_carterae.1